LDSIAVSRANKGAESLAEYIARSHKPDFLYKRIIKKKPMNPVSRTAARTDTLKASSSSPIKTPVAAQSQIYLQRAEGK